MTSALNIGPPIVKAVGREQRVERNLDQLRLLEFAKLLAYEHGVSLSDLIGHRGNGRIEPSRARFVRARHHLWLLIRHTLNLSYPEIAQVFEVDHTTVMYAVKKFEREIEARHAEAP